MNRVGLRVKGRRQEVIVSPGLHGKSSDQTLRGSEWTPGVYIPP